MNSITATLNQVSLKEKEKELCFFSFKFFKTAKKPYDDDSIMFVWLTHWRDSLIKFLAILNKQNTKEERKEK